MIEGHAAQLSAQLAGKGKEESRASFNNLLYLGGK
jgi:hypothetical protein